MRSLISQISIHKLEVFCLVAELRSFSRAAERLGIAQPVVSAHVKSLAERLGGPLMQRDGRRLALTDEGNRAYLWASEIVRRTHELEREITARDQGSVGTATLSASMTLGSYVLPPMINAFHRRTPMGNISVRITTPMLATDTVQEGDCDFAFTILDPRHETSGLSVKHVADETLILVASDKTGFASKSCEPVALAELTFVTAQSGTPRREIEEAALARFGVHRKRISIEFGHAEAIKQAVRAGAGLAFLFRSSATDELASGVLREIETPGMELRVPVYQIHRKDKNLSTFQRSLMAFLADGIGAHETLRRAEAIEGA